MAAGFFDSVALSNHNHSSTSGDGGVLTNPGFTGVATETGTPTTPTALSTILTALAIASLSEA